MHEKWADIIVISIPGEAEHANLPALKNESYVIYYNKIVYVYQSKQ